GCDMEPRIRLECRGLAQRRRLPAHQRGVVLPRREHRNRCRTDRGGQGGLPGVSSAERLPAVRAGEQPGSRHLGGQGRRGAPQTAQRMARQPAPGDEIGDRV
ncbi:MAG: Transcriptional regulator, WhiB family, partial [uncultured Acidimicrobiales bacterium]